jgi:hypothetical protein
MAYIKDKYYLGGDLYLGNLNKHIDYINEKLDSRISGLIVLNKEESAKYITYSPDDFLRRVISSEYNNRILIDLYTTEYGFEMTSLNNESAEDHMIYIALNLFNRYKVVSFRNTDKNILISLSEKFNKIIDTKSELITSMIYSVCMILQKPICYKFLRHIHPRIFNMDFSYQTV